MSGIVRLNDSIVSRMLTHVPHPLTSRPIFWMRFPKFTAAVSISSTLRSRNFPSFHPSYATDQSAAISHRDVRSSMSCSQRASSLSGGAGSLNTFRPLRRSASRWRNAARAALAFCMKIFAPATTSMRVALSVFIGAPCSNVAR